MSFWEDPAWETTAQPIAGQPTHEQYTYEHFIQEQHALPALPVEPIIELLPTFNYPHQPGTSGFNYPHQPGTSGLQPGTSAKQPRTDIPKTSQPSSTENIAIGCTSIKSDIHSINEQLTALRSGMITDLKQINEKLDLVLKNMNARTFDTDTESSDNQLAKCANCGNTADAYASCTGKCLLCKPCIKNARKGNQDNRKRNYCPICDISVSQFRYFN